MDIEEQYKLEQIKCSNQLRIEDFKTVELKLAQS
jgi:hypothetical protein